MRIKLCPKNMVGGQLGCGGKKKDSFQRGTRAPLPVMAGEKLILEGDDKGCPSEPRTRVRKLIRNTWEGLDEKKGLSKKKGK